jgi:hypothetical protein
MSESSIDLDDVRKLSLELPDVKENTTKRGAGWKLRGKLMACEAIHKSAEPDSLMVRVSTEDRKRLLKEQSTVFYLTDHYRPYAAILVRLSKVDYETLRDVLRRAWQFVGDDS